MKVLKIAPFCLSVRGAGRDNEEAPLPGQNSNRAAATTADTVPGGLQRAPQGQREEESDGDEGMTVLLGQIGAHRGNGTER